MKKCSHGDLELVTVDSIRKGASFDRTFYVFGDTKYKFICNRILLSKLIRTMTEIK